MFSVSLIGINLAALPNRLYTMQALTKLLKRGGQNLSMGWYITKRLLLIIPTLFGIMLLNFSIVQSAPGGPVEQMVAKLQGFSHHDSGQLSASSESLNRNPHNRYGIDDETLKQIQHMYGFDRPASQRFYQMMKDYLSFNFGNSFYRDSSVLQLIKQTLPVSISLGLWSTLLI